MKRLLSPTLLAALACACAAPVPGPGVPRGPDDVPAPPGSLADEAAARRHALAAELGEGLVWVDGAPADDEGRFFQEKNALYLSGVEIAGLSFALVVEDGAIAEEVLFLPAHDPLFEVWNGPRLAPGAEAERVTGFAHTAPLDERQAWLDARAPERVFVLDADAAAHASVTPPPGAEVDTLALRDALGTLRWIKSEYELACLRNAIDITGAAQWAVADVVAPGRYEYELQAALEGTFLRLGAERPGFASICGSGPNSVTLHYIDNRRRMEDGDLVVVDIGAKFRGYCADVTRTYPVGGRFTPRQREVYDVVLAAQREAARAARPGMTIRDLHEIARGVLAEHGLDEYFVHGVGHWIGLHVHDLSDLRRDGDPPRERRPIEPGSVFTLEPGVYIRDEALGVRIEDDYLMTHDGAVRLSTSMPSDADEIEAVLAR